MKTFLTLALADALFAMTAWAPTAAASPSTSCTVNAGNPTCTFPCNVGEYVHVYMSAGPANYAVSNANCGGAWTALHPLRPEGHLGTGVRAEERVVHDRRGGRDLQPGGSTPVGASVYATCWTEPFLEDFGLDRQLGDAYRGLAFSEGVRTTLPEVGGDVTTPPVSTPGVDAVSSPPVTIPGPCAVGPCGPIVVPPAQVPSVHVRCETTDGLVCVGPTPPMTVFPRRRGPSRVRVIARSFRRAS